MAPKAIETVGPPFPQLGDTVARLARLRVPAARLSVPTVGVSPFRLRHMHVPTNSVPPSSTGPLRLEGHMADDVAATFGPKPGAVLQATTDELWIQGNRGDFRIPRTAITAINRGGLYPWFFKGIRVRHSIDGLPRRILFLPFEGDTAALLNQLQALGFPRA